MDDYKNCPFCGGEAYLSEDSKGFMIECFGCGVSMGGNWTKDSVLEAWNKRTVVEDTVIDVFIGDVFESGHKMVFLGYDYCFGSLSYRVQNLCNKATHYPLPETLDKKYRFVNRRR